WLALLQFAIFRNLACSIAPKQKPAPPSAKGDASNAQQSNTANNAPDVSVAFPSFCETSVLTSFDFPRFPFERLVLKPIRLLSPLVSVILSRLDRSINDGLAARPERGIAFGLRGRNGGGGGGRSRGGDRA